jgi:hypothetical protein
LRQALAAQSGEAPKQPPIFTRHTARESMNLFAGSRARILIAEDNSTNQQVAIGILGKLGLRADALDGDREKCLEAGMNGFVSKPISPMALAEVLEKWLPKYSGGIQASAAAEHEKQ